MIVRDVISSLGQMTRSLYIGLSSGLSKSNDDSRL